MMETGRFGSGAPGSPVPVARVADSEMDMRFAILTGMTGLDPERRPFWRYASWRSKVASG